MPNGDDKQKYNTPIPSGAQVGEPIPQGATIGDADGGDVSDPTRGYAKPSTASAVGREGALGLFQGLGIPETQTPVTDLAKSMIPSARDIVEFPFAPAKAVYGIGKGLYGAGKELFGGPQDEPEQAAHGLGSLIGQGLQLAGLAKGGETGAGAAETAVRGRARLGDFLHDPRTGEAKSVPKAINDLAINTIAPESSERVAGRQMESKAQDLMRRGKEQDILDRRAAMQARQAARLGQGLSLEPGKGGKLVKTPEELAHDERASRIAKIGSEPPGQKRNLDAYPRAQLFEMAKKGDLDAIDHLQRNPSKYGLPPNSKYLIEPNRRTVPWRDYPE
jgi:hypothetical protein